MSFSASIASGGASEFPFRGTNSFGCPFSATVASKFVKTTSPFKKGAIADTVEGVYKRMSDRIIDCPVKTTVSAAGCGHAITPIENMKATETAKNEKGRDLLLNVVILHFQIRCSIVGSVKGKKTREQFNSRPTNRNRNHCLTCRG